VVRTVALQLVVVSSLLALMASPAPAWAQDRALLVPVRGPGADDAALQAATFSLGRRLEIQGYVVVQPAAGTAAVAVDAAPADLGALAQQASAVIVVDAVLQEFAGMTSLRVRVISAGGGVLGEDANLATPATLPQDAVQILANALRTVPPPTAGAAPPPAGVESPFGAGPAATGPAATGTQPYTGPRARVRRRPDFPERRFWLGGLIEPAIGTNRSALNLLIGFRGEFQWRGLTVGLDFNYTYIKDWEPRSDPDYNTISIFAMLGYQIRLGSQRLTLPLLVGGGYIPGNGGLLRFEAGLSIRPIDRLQIRIIFVCPNIWFLGDETVVFTSLSLQLLGGIR
jgi:hypothetical protein